MQLIRLDGLRFHYLFWANPDGLATVCLHGIGDTCHTWDAFGEKASEAFTVIALDQREHGHSDWAIPPAYRCDDYVCDLTAFVDTLNLERIILLGHSMGALHSTWYASEKPEKVAALIHVDIAPRPPAWNRRYLMRLYENVPESYDSPEHFVKELRQTSAFAGEEMTRSLPRGMLVEIPRSGHPIHVDNPEGFNEAVMGFLKELGLSPPVIDSCCEQWMEPVRL